MRLGPIHPTWPGKAFGYDPPKPIRVQMETGKQAFLFDSSYPYALQQGVFEINTDMVLLQSTQASLLAVLHQIEELAANAEWQRAGVFIQWREDGTLDGEDGWYTIKQFDTNEDLIFSAYAEPKIDVELRARRKPELGIYIDQKYYSNFLLVASGAVALAALPQGVTSTFPAVTWNMVGADGATIGVIESPSSSLRGNFSNPTNCMTLGRCQVFDSTADKSTTVTEVFWRDHRWVSNTVLITNQLLRYTISLGTPGDPLLEVWDQATSAWLTVGNYRLQGYSGSAYTTLPLQGFSLITVSPEEIIWEERRYDATGAALVRCVNRIRRGYRTIECQIVAASGQGLTGISSVNITNMPGTPALVSISSTTTNYAAEFTTGASVAAAVMYLDTPVTSLQGVNLQTAQLGISVPAGTVFRFGLACLNTVTQDAQYNAFVAPAAPVISSVTPTPAGGATTWSYTVTAITKYGTTSAASAVVSTTTGPAALSNSVFNTITWGAVTGATQYIVTCTAAGGTPNNTGDIATVVAPTTSYQHKGVNTLAQPRYTQAQTLLISYWAYNFIRVRQRMIVGG
jgi:hypothetical protein